MDPRSGYPIYLQLVEQIERAVAVGILSPGQQLPTVKAIAGELIINPATVGRAMRELERLEIISSLPGRGSFVNDNGTVSATRHAAQRTVQTALDSCLREARSLGVPEDAVRAIVDMLMGRWYGDTRGDKQ